MAHQLWTRDDPLVVKSHPKEGPSPGVDLLRKLSRVLKRAGVNVRGVMTLEVILEEGQTKVLAEIKD